MSTLMIQGATSDAGKSAFVTGLCRILKRNNISVAPFKPQNMALNSAVTSDQGEIGRAQAIQAFAAGIPTHTDMNPVLLKPNSDTGSQIIIQGTSIGNMDACEYHAYKAVAQQAVLESYQRLRNQYDVILVEGAGSPAEINLRKNDIANMGFAEKVDCPVLLIADIERGGVFAHLYGTLALLSPSEQTRIKGFIINRFRGNPELLTSGIDWLEKKCEKKVLGVLPYLHDFHLEAEDSLSRTNPIVKKKNALNIIVPALPRLSNHTDFDALRLHPDVNLKFINTGETIPPADLIILPGSKSVQADMQWLFENQWHMTLKKHLRYGGKVIGICGGFQMLGNSIHDPQGIEGQAGSKNGLQLFDMETTLQKNKTLRNVTGTLSFDGAKFEGYEIHAGISQGKALSNPAITFDGQHDGAISIDNQILGTYIHGLFDHSEACHSLLRWANLKDIPIFSYRKLCNENIDRLADCMEEYIDISKINKLLK